MILGDSLVVMNSLVQYEGMGGKVQMIYIDPPYGVKFGSNFQPFVRKQTVTHNEDDDFTREPEMVQAYRDTWELGLHSYLTYLRDRLLLARELLTDSGSVFVQISDENVHHVRELMDEVLGRENFISIVVFNKTSGSSSKLLSATVDYMIWYAKNKKNIKCCALYNENGRTDNEDFNYCEFEDGSVCKLDKISETETRKFRQFKLDDSSSQGETSEGSKPYTFQGKQYYPTPGRHFSHTKEGIDRLVQLGYVMAKGNRLFYKNYLDTAHIPSLNDVWLDTQLGGYKRKLQKVYVVQTATKVIQRCLLMTTAPGDLVFDITCGSGTTAYVAEQWGRRWITCDVSRVPLALARQRLLTATFPYYELKDESKGPSGGFVYKRKQNKKGEEVGGIVPHVTLKSIANNEPPKEEILVDRPEQINSITRVCGPFVVEGIIPPPVNMEGQEEPETEAIEPDSAASFTDRMLEVLRKSPVLHLPNNKTITFTNVRQPARSQIISAEALVKSSDLTCNIQSEFFILA